MARSFIEAAGYVARNEAMWQEMISACWREWIDENKIVIKGDTQEAFVTALLKQYGIQCWWNDGIRQWDFQVIDPVKYTFFQMKYAR
jgi:hypothetical protein